MTSLTQHVQKAGIARRLFKLDESEEFLESYDCKYRSKWVSKAGQMWVFSEHVLFYSNLFGSEISKFLPIDQILSVEVTSSAIRLSLDSGVTHSFSNFSSKTALRQCAAHIQSITDPSVPEPVRQYTDGDLLDRGTSEASHISTPDAASGFSLPMHGSMPSLSSTSKQRGTSPDPLSPAAHSTDSALVSVLQSPSRGRRRIFKRKQKTPRFSPPLGAPVQTPIEGEKVTSEGLSGEKKAHKILGVDEKECAETPESSDSRSRSEQPLKEEASGSRDSFDDTGDISESVAKFKEFATENGEALLKSSGTSTTPMAYVCALSDYASMSKWKNVVNPTEINGSLEDLFVALYMRDTLMCEIHAQRGTRNLSIGDWQPTDEVSDAESVRTSKRSLTYITPIKDPPPFMANETGVNERQRIRCFGHKSFVMDMSCQTPDIKYGDYFFIVQVYSFRSVTTADGSTATIIEAKVGLNWVKSTMFRSVIESKAIADCKEGAGKWLAKVKRLFPAAPRPLLEVRPSMRTGPMAPKTVDSGLLAFMHKQPSKVETLKGWAKDGSQWVEEHRYETALLCAIATLIAVVVAAIVTFFVTMHNRNELILAQTEMVRELTAQLRALKREGGRLLDASGPLDVGNCSLNLSASA